jgi:hypothetical protein
MFTAETVRTLLHMFDRTVATGLLPERVVRACEADLFHQFILAGAGRRLGVGDRKGAGRIMRLLRMPEVRALGLSRRWFPIRMGMWLLVLMPTLISQRVARGPLPRILVDAALAGWPENQRRQLENDPAKTNYQQSAVSMLSRDL